ncbi:transposase [Facklamia sp. P13055]|uniref:transposase n=1 Tax=Facklamia sp. P13055 TaxID=3421952 RepID=UPI003D185957
MHFPKEIWASLYTNKLSEAFNKQLKKRTKVKEQFPHEASLEKAVYCYITEYNAKFRQRIHKGFGKVTFELRNLLDQRRPINETKLREGITKPQVS